MPEVKAPTAQENLDIFEAAFAQIAAADNAGTKLPEQAASVSSADNPIVGPTDKSMGNEITGPTGPTEPQGLPEQLEVIGQTGATGPTEPTEPTPEQKAAEKVAADAAANEVARVAQEEQFIKHVKTVVETTQPPAPLAPPKPALPIEQQLFTPEEIEFLTAYDKEFPDIARAETIRRRADLRMTVGYVFDEVTRSLQPLVQQIQNLAARTHLGDIHQAVPDYDTTREQVIAWVDKQPPYLKAAYQRVVQQGSVDEVADLINRYKKDTGVVAPPAPVKPEPELTPAAKKAAAALAPVSSKRSGAVITEPQDFDGAFGAAAAALAAEEERERKANR
jgi:hypothetical protein